MPQVSVLMVFHRVTPFFEPAVRSVLEQTFDDLELVLVDNGTGLPVKALGELGADPRVHWVRLPCNEGIPSGHNAGVAAARGEFIALQDYDDIALPHRLERQVATLRADPGIGLVRPWRNGSMPTGGSWGGCFACRSPVRIGPTPNMQRR